MKYNRAGSVIFSVPWSHATPSSGIASVSVRTVDIQEDLIHFYLNTDKATPQFGFCHFSVVVYIHETKLWGGFYLNTDKATPQFGFVDVNNNGEMTEIKP